MVQPDTPFKAVERSKIYSSVVEQILDNIRRETFPPGSALPAERVLAEQLEVSRGSLREAIRVLEHAGVLDVRVGSGTYVMADSRSNTTVLRAQAAVIGEHSPLDLIVARSALEPLCAEQAARSRHPSDLEAMEAALDEQGAAMRAGRDPSEPDLAFHLAVAAATHNGVLLALQQATIELMREGTWSQLKHRSRESSNAAWDYLRHHELVLGAIRDSDPRRASHLMLMHLSEIETGLLQQLEQPEQPSTESR